MMEVQLSRIFQTASHWNALILLDEADVFLEQRSAHDLERNKLVSSEYSLDSNRSDVISVIIL